MTTKKKGTEERPTLVEIPALKIKTFSLSIIGESPLIVHAWSDKAKLMMLNKQTKKASSGREVRRPYVDFADSLYWLSDKPDFDELSDEEAAEVLGKTIPDASFGFPTVAFKAAAASGARRSHITKDNVSTYAAFHIRGQYVTITGTPQIREDMVRIGKGIADLRYRAEFPEWQTMLDIEYNEQAMSIEQIFNLFNIGGFACGVGEWRPEKGGSYGRFRVG